MSDDTDQKQTRRKARRPWEFLAVFLILFFAVSVFLYAIDFVPEPKAASAAAPVVTTSAQMVHAVPEEPVAIRIPAIGVDTPITNPATTSVTALDAALLNGAVRYPASAELGQMGTVYLFGHQSYLPVIHNQAFKAFNNVQKLKEGDIITVSSATTEYQYQVASVTLTTATDGVIPLRSDGRTLILSTCNSFSSDHEQRYIVTAAFISQTPRDL